MAHSGYGDTEYPCRFKPVHLRHSVVKQENVRFHTGSQFYCVASVLCFPAHHSMIVHSEAHAKRRSYLCTVIDDQYSRHAPRLAVYLRLNGVNGNVAL